MEGVSLGIAIASLTIAALGFAIAVRQIRKSRSAAERAEAAANNARSSMEQAFSITDLTQASALIDQLKELHLHQAFDRAIDRYTPLRQLLTRASTRLTESKTTFASANQQLRIMEEEARHALREGHPVSGDRLDAILLEMQQALDEARAELERLLASNLEGVR